MYALSRRACGNLILAVSVLIVAALLPAPTRASAAASSVLYVATNGSDANPGTLEQPYRTLGYALQQLNPGDTLNVRGGNYVERIQNVPLRSGTPSERITVQNYAGERPVIVGLLWLRSPSYWTFSGINVTWDPNNGDTTQHMLKLTGGTGWVYTAAEIWGARSFAGVLVTGGATGWSLDHLYVHDTHRSNGANQDHLIYISLAFNGVIERNLLVNSENGRGIKLARPAPGDGAPAFVTVRYNTFISNAGANISTSYDAHDNQIYGNLMVGSGDHQNITALDLIHGASTIVRDNIGWQARDNQVIEPNAGLTDAGGNRSVDPWLDAGFRPTNPAILDANGTPIAGHLARIEPATAPRTRPRLP